MVQVSTVEEALACLASIEAGEQIDEITLAGELSTLKIWMDGPKYHASIPGELARGLWEFQEAIYKAAAFALTGSEDIRKLAAAQRENLELVFEVSEGSLDIGAKIAEICTEIVKGISNMSEINRIRTYLCIALIIAGGVVAWKALDVSGEAKKEQVKAELAIGLEAERTRQLDIFAGAVRQEPILQRFEKASEEGTKSIVRSASDATAIRVGRTQFDRDDIDEVTRRAPRTQTVSDVISMEFRIFKVEVREADIRKYVLAGQGTGEFVATMDENQFTQQEIAAVMAAANERRPISLEVLIAKANGTIRSAQIMQVL